MKLKKFNDWINESVRDRMKPKITEEEANKLITPLKSVGCGIDKNGITYVMLTDGGYEYTGWHIDLIENEEWWEKLTDEDRKIIDEITRKKIMK